jgi:hypothetical protein
VHVETLRVNQLLVLVPVHPDRLLLVTFFSQLHPPATRTSSPTVSAAAALPPSHGECGGGGGAPLGAGARRVKTVGGSRGGSVKVEDVKRQPFQRALWCV